MKILYILDEQILRRRHPSFHLSIILSIYISIHHFIHLSVHPSIHLMDLKIPPLSLPLKRRQWEILSRCFDGCLKHFPSDWKMELQTAHFKDFTNLADSHHSKWNVGSKTAFNRHPFLSFHNLWPMRTLPCRED